MAPPPIELVIALAAFVGIVAFACGRFVAQPSPASLPPATTVTSPATAWVRDGVTAQVHRLDGDRFDVKLCETTRSGNVTQLAIHSLVVDRTTAQWIVDVLSTALRKKDPTSEPRAAKSEAEVSSLKSEAEGKGSA